MSLIDGNKYFFLYNMDMISHALPHIHTSAHPPNDRKELSVKGICSDLSCEVDMLRSLYHLERETNMDKAKVYTPLFFSNFHDNIKLYIYIEKYLALCCRKSKSSVLC